ncbi:MAG: hypothetical protein CME70_14440 [Halobacteriovorax sp.]|nr:hypothetical protein [Halobacteriovorax sp.]|tara:strand:- start:250295 stop:250495 length:201 start_codon:yes stop_codon:yes gene_type:complete
MTIEEALKLVRKAVKHSHLDNQPHIDLSVCTADKRIITQEALTFLQAEVVKGNMTEDELKEKLGLA